MNRNIVRRKLFVLAIVSAIASPSASRADCPAAPIGDLNDMVVSFLATNGTQAAPSNLLPSSVKEGMFVYDDTANTLKVCNGTAWAAVGPSSATPAGTVAGAVQFRGSSAVFAADDANFIWDNTNKRLGIGTTEPGTTLQVAGPTGGNPWNAIMATTNSWTTGSSGSGVRIGPGASSGNTYGFIDVVQSGGNTSGGNLVISPYGGNVGIGTASPSQKLDVNGAIIGRGGLYITGLANAGFPYIVCYDNSSKQLSWAGVGTCTTSDARAKTDVRPLSDDEGLTAIMKLQSVRFDWRDVERDAAEGPQLGMIAQDVEKVFPELVTTNKLVRTIQLAGGKTAKIENPKSLKYEGLVVPLVKAVQQLKADNDALETRNQQQDSEIDALRKEIDALKAKAD